MEDFVGTLEIDDTASSFVIPKPLTENILISLCADSNEHKASWLSAFSEVPGCEK